MRALALALLFALPAFAANQAACQDHCNTVASACQDQCAQRFPKNKQDTCKNACKAATPRCQERCKGDKKK